MSVSVAVNAQANDRPATLFAKFASDDLEGPKTEVPFSDWHPLAKLRCPTGGNGNCKADLSASMYNPDFEILVSLELGNRDRQNDVFHQTHHLKTG